MNRNLSYRFISFTLAMLFAGCASSGSKESERPKNMPELPLAYALMGSHNFGENCGIVLADEEGGVWDGSQADGAGIYISRIGEMDIINFYIPLDGSYYLKYYCRGKSGKKHTTVSGKRLRLKIIYGADKLKYLGEIYFDDKGKFDRVEMNQKYQIYELLKKKGYFKS